MTPIRLQNSTRMGFEPTRALPNGLAVHRLNHSATSSSYRTTFSARSTFVQVTGDFFPLNNADLILTCTHYEKPLSFDHNNVTWYQVCWLMTYSEEFSSSHSFVKQGFKNNEIFISIKWFLSFLIFDGKSCKFYGGIFLPLNLYFIVIRMVKVSCLIVPCFL